jgi:TatA/E family protein of Tat protein translocase
MLGVGMQELIIILVVALLVFGPKRLPELARSMGRAFAEFRRATEDIKESLTLDVEEEKDWEKDRTVKKLTENDHESSQPG